jgi:hypothetical protein
MKKLTSIIIVTMLTLLCLNSVSSAIEHWTRRYSDSSLDIRFHVSGEETERILHQFGYTYGLADFVAKNILWDIGIPSSFTGKIAYLGTYLVLVYKVQNDLYTNSQRDPSYTYSGWTLTYICDPEYFRRVDSTLGKLGDGIMSNDEATKRIIGVVNDILNTASANR